MARIALEGYREFREYGPFGRYYGLSMPPSSVHVRKLFGDVMVLLFPLLACALCACSILLAPLEGGEVVFGDSGTDVGGDEGGRPADSGELDAPEVVDSSPDGDIDADADANADADFDDAAIVDGDSPEVPVKTLIAWDGFEGGNVTSGEGWNQNWYFDETDSEISTGGTPTKDGSWHLILWGEGYGDRTVDLERHKGVKLAFWARGENLGGSDKVDVRYIPHDDGSADYHCCLLTLNASTLGRDYTRHEVVLHSATSAKNYGIAFQSEMSGSLGRVYIDEIEVYSLE